MPGTSKNIISHVHESFWVGWSWPRDKNHLDFADDLHLDLGLFTFFTIQRSELQSKQNACSGDCRLVKSKITLLPLQPALDLSQSVVLIIQEYQ